MLEIKCYTWKMGSEPQQVESQPSISKFLVSSLSYDANES